MTERGREAESDDSVEGGKERKRERDEPKCDAAECCNRTGFGRRGNTGKCTLTQCRSHEHTLTRLKKKTREEESDEWHLKSSALRFTDVRF